ncbi:hypothetical protein I5Q34_16865 [Streptomyces sp. AV19]|nr:hypothetical protein [Streptomyces sp. AV19]MBH1935921.1 hypothetical protein [Streptomyces sp. AV19]MDG4534296.1 hypothetical protein [Streptomyces sp. AV19]
MNEPPTQTPCAECRRIKAEYYRAWRAGDRDAAEALCVAMGRHQRMAH